jgi:hypothetical protein
VMVWGFQELAERMGGRVAGHPRSGLSFAADCPWCGGRLLVWTRRPGPHPLDEPGFRCADCGREDVIGWLRLRLRELAA